jgi:hypothetical protein
MEELAFIKMSFNAELHILQKAKLLIAKSISMQFDYETIQTKNGLIPSREINCDFKMLQKASIYQSNLIHKEVVSKEINGIMDFYFTCSSAANVNYISGEAEVLEEIKINLNYPETLNILIKKNEIQKMIEYAPYLLGFGIIYYFTWKTITKLLRTNKIIL